MEREAAVSNSIGAGSAHSMEEGSCDSVVLTGSDIAESLTSLGEDVGEAILQLESTIMSLLSTSSSVTFEKVLFAVFIAFIGAMSAYLFNYFHWKMIEKKQRVSNIGMALNSLVNDLESISIDYWVQDYKVNDIQEIHAIEILIKSKTRLISRYVPIFVCELHSGRNADKIKKLEEFRLDIFDLVTGDEFESKDRKASKPKALQIANRCSDIRAMISSL